MASWWTPSRTRVAELMDQPNLDPSRHESALRGLARLNRVSGSGRILWSALRPHASAQPLRVLDIACGGGDVLLDVHRRARRAGVDLRLAGCDVQPRAVAYAQQRAEEAGADLRFFPLDALRDPLPGDYDVVMCSLFLHHLDDEDAVQLLGAMKSAARRVVLVNDLERGPLAYAVVWLGARVLTRSDVVAVDGPRSVRAAYSRNEVMELAQRAELHGAMVQRRFPFRWLLSWERA